MIFTMKIRNIGYQKLLLIYILITVWEEKNAKGIILLSAWGGGGNSQASGTKHNQSTQTKNPPPHAGGKKGRAKDQGPFQSSASA